MAETVSSPLLILAATQVCPVMFSGRIKLPANLVIQCSPDSGSVLEHFRVAKGTKQGFSLTTGYVISIQVKGNRLVAMTAKFFCKEEVITGPYGEFRVTGNDRQQLLDFLRKKLGVSDLR